MNKYRKINESYEKVLVNEAKATKVKDFNVMLSKVKGLKPNDNVVVVAKGKEYKLKGVQLDEGPMENKLIILAE